MEMKLSNTMADLMEATERIEQLIEALATRDRIGQAKGILMERYRVTEHQAFELLSAASQSSNTKLVDLADNLTSTGEFMGLNGAMRVRPAPPLR